MNGRKKVYINSKRYSRLLQSKKIASYNSDEWLEHELYRRNKLIGYICYIIPGIFIGLILLLLLYFGFDKHQVVPMILATSFLLGLTIISIRAGYRIIGKAPNGYKSKFSFKKTFFKIAILSLIISILLLIAKYVYSTKNHYEVAEYYRNEIVTNTVYSTSGLYKNSRYSIFIKDKNIYVDCTQEELEKIDKPFYKNDQMKQIYYFEYVWNEFNPRKGKLIKLLVNEEYD